MQSTALLVMSALGLKNCPKADVAIFADTQDEPRYVYEHLAFLTGWAKQHGIEVHTTTAGRLSDDVLALDKGQRTKFVPIPVFTLGSNGKESMLRRQCTREYKITPIEKKVRELLGYIPRQRMKHTATALIGISLDEFQRMKDSRTHWIKNEYPLVDARMTRQHCLELIKENGIPEPKKSACRYCPYHDNEYWADLKANHPEEFEQAAKFDRSIRNMSKSGEAVFIHRLLKPLGEIDFVAEEEAKKELEARQGRIDFGFKNECEGMCGV